MSLTRESFSQNFPDSFLSVIGYGCTRTNPVRFLRCKAELYFLQYEGWQHGTTSQTTAPLWCVLFLRAWKAPWVGPFFIPSTSSSSSWHMTFSVRWPKVVWAHRAGTRLKPGSTCKLFTEWAKGHLYSRANQRAALYSKLHVMCSAWEKGSWPTCN